MVAAIVYAADSVPVESVDSFGGVAGAAGAALVPDGQHLALSQLQGDHFTGPRSPLTVILFGALIYLIWNYSQPVLLALATFYVGTGIADSRRRHHPPQIPSPSPAAPAGASN